MPLKIPNEELQAILEVVASGVKGASVRELLADARLDFKRRTLQRRLDLLCEQGQLVPQGEGRGRRYHAAASLPGQATAVRGTTPDPDWLSAEAVEIRKLLSRPPSKRQPIGYDASFLKSYQPNTTFYLPLATRSRLAGMGQVGISDLPAGTYLRRMCLSGPMPARPNATTRCANPSVFLIRFA